MNTLNHLTKNPIAYHGNILPLFREMANDIDPNMPDPEEYEERQKNTPDDLPLEEDLDDLEEIELDEDLEFPEDDEDIFLDDDFEY